MGMVVVYVRTDESRAAFSFPIALSPFQQAGTPRTMMMMAMAMAMASKCGVMGAQLYA
jgi:hypothetical protein